ncbi:uncharacterized protein LOC111693327 [Trichogramma pretiosum]|nr:uncharacterized protein LOC111693327 [Trichogramma pretiosum]
MGTHLRNIKKRFGRTLLSDGKTIGGKGRLTAKVIDQLSSYYTQAIRRNTTVTSMRNDIWATFFHKKSTDKKPQHHLCPAGATSWCKWQKAKAQGTLKKFTHNSSIPEAIMDEIEKTYEELSKPELLVKCIGAFSQNVNESLNHLLWKYVPKKQWSGGTILNIGAFIAVSTFNDGKTALLKIMKELDIQPGPNAIEFMKQSDDKRIYQANIQAASSSKQARSARLKRRHNDPNDDSYVPGGH